MKITTILLVLLFPAFLFGQRVESFGGIDFDSSYTVIGIGQHHKAGDDSLPRFWFILDNPQDLLQLKKEWVFKNRPLHMYFETNDVDIFVIKDKRLVPSSAMIYPVQGLINTDRGWYDFDTAK